MITFLFWWIVACVVATGFFCILAKGGSGE